MKLLSLDTSTPLAGVAVYDPETGAAAVRRERVTTHSETLLLLIEAALGEAGLVPGDLGGVVCGAGPGSFTGLRIGVATAKGLCFALRIPLLMISSLEALAQAAETPPGMKEGPPGMKVLACLDASRGQVYARLFVKDPIPDPVRGVLSREPGLGFESAWDPVELARALAPISDGLVLCGDGPLRHPELCLPGSRLLPDPSPHPLDLARLGAPRILAGEHHPLASAAPNYVCPSAAERAAAGVKRGT